MRDLFTTIGTRYLIAILNLALIFINAKVLGVEGVGLVGLILAIVGIATMFCGILAGNTIVYFMKPYFYPLTAGHPPELASLAAAWPSSEYFPKGTPLIFIFFPF
jgi:hypothetical protein